MKAEKLDSGEWVVSEEDRSQKFQEIVGGLAFGDPAEEGDYALHGFAVVGLDLAGRCILLEEFLGIFEDLGTEATNLKDRYLLRGIHCEPEPKQFRRQLEALDGLTQYEPKGYRGKVPIYKRHGSTWPYFRDRRALASLVPVVKEIIEEFDAWIARVSAMGTAGDLQIADWCLKAKRLDREGFARGREHPLLKAFVFAVATLLRNHQPVPAKQKAESSACWYGNPRRR